jgi:two-component system CheB/CheR fusion protein
VDSGQANRQTAASVPADTARPTSIVGVGASAGGLEAFTQLLHNLPVDTGMAFVLVQHLDPAHESELAGILARATSMPTHEVSDNLRVEPNHVYVIPPNVNMSIVRGELKLLPRPAGRAPHRSVDFFFESLAQDQRERAIGVVLSGTASDGTLGLEAIKAEAGITFAQDGSAKYDSMPRSAVAAGCVDFVLAPEKIAQELARIASHPYIASLNEFIAAEPQVEDRAATGPSGEDERTEATAHQDDATPLPSGGHGAPPIGALQARGEAKSDPARPADNGFKKVLSLLHEHSGVDFTLYKSTTIQRRVARRVILNKLSTVDEYAAFLKGNAKELDTLYSDVLISVTSFFRNPDAFEVLKHEVFPKLFHERNGDAPVRVWVLGCSTGQEAYSIAMSFAEFAESIPGAAKLQVFATDLNNTLLDKARRGLYARMLAEDVSPERLRRFFVEEEGGYRVSKLLRDQIVFARQNVISDPPFSRMDLISCRNLMIYLEPHLQAKLVPTFHYALKSRGFLFLGASESIGRFTDLFEPIDKKHKIFVRKAASISTSHLPVDVERTIYQPPGRRPPVLLGTEQDEQLRTELNAQREADRVSVHQFAPPGVLINAENQILQFRGPTGAFFEPPEGRASFDVLKMARAGLMLPLLAAINEAKKENQTVRKEHVPVEQNDGAPTVTIQVIPLKNLKVRCFLILFESAAPQAGFPPLNAPPQRTFSEKEESQRIATLERQLAEIRDYVQSVQEQAEAANEELQASNEEVQSANEELQSINEELETSKEELESTNEELTTVNEEMVKRNAELNRLLGDLNNLQVSIQTPILLFGRDLTIRRFTGPATKLFNLLAGDIGRPLSGVRHNLVEGKAHAAPAAAQAPYPLENLIREVIDTVGTRDCEVQDNEGRWYAMRVRPYLTPDNKLDGAVLVLVDIDSLKRAAQESQKLAAIVESSDDAIISKDLDGTITSWNRGAERLFGYTAKEIIGRSVTVLIPPECGDDEPRIRERLCRGERIEQYDTVRRRKDGTLVHISLTVSPITDDHGKVVAASKIARDITDQKRAEEELKNADRHKNEFLALLAHELRNPLAPISNAVQILRHAQGDADSIQAATEMMERQVGQMARLVDDLLDISRISLGKIELRRGRIELASVVSQAVEAARSSVRFLDRELTVTLPPQPMYLDADPTRLSQIIGNLLHNACKFSDKGSRIWLTAEREGGQAVIHVRDTGIGIASDQLTRVFDMFTQLDSSLERSAGGLGIGLALVKNLVDLHGGTVEARSAGLGQGSEFTVRLPIGADTAEPLPLASPDRPPAPVTSRRILVVDDNHDSAKSLAMLLKATGNETHTVYDGQAAVEAAATFRPEVVLLDIGLPKLNGYDAARRIREQPWGKGMLLVALTGWGQEEDRQKSKDAGFDCHLVKPVEYPALEKLLATLPHSPDGPLSVA